MKKAIILLLTVYGIVLSVSAQEKDSLDAYLEMAAKNNPAVMAAFHAYEAALQKIPQMSALNDPQLDIGFFLKPMEIIDGRQIADFRLMQMFPWFGTRKAARTEAQHMAAMSFEQFRETRNNLFLEVYTQWYVLCRLQQRLIIYRSALDLYKHLETLALRKFSSGGSISSQGNTMNKAAGNNANTSPGSGMSGMNMGNANRQPQQQTTSSTPSMSGNSDEISMSAHPGMTEVLRIQLEEAETENSTESIALEIIAEKARFNSLLNRPAESGIIIPDTIVQRSYLLDINSVIQMITEQNPMLGMYREKEKAHIVQAEMVRKMGYPMFGIGLQYMLIGKTNTPVMESNMNGKDMIMPMLSFTIPIYRGKYKAALREAQMQQQESRARYTDALNHLESDLYAYRYQLDDALRKISLYRRQTELSQVTYNLLVQEFISGKSDLTAVIQMQKQLLDYQLKDIEAVADYNTITAKIQQLISPENAGQ